MKISILLPARNERDGVVATIRSIPFDELKSRGYELEVIVVDNGSMTNRTKINAETNGAIVVYESEKGYGNACRAGFRVVSGDIVVLADADATYPMESVPDLLDNMTKNNLDFITTNRLNLKREGVMKFRNKFGNMMISAMVKLFFNIDINDSESGMVLIKTDLLDGMVFKDMGFAFCREIKIEACYYLKCKWKEYNIDYRKRIGNTNMKAWKVGMKALIHIVGKRFYRG